MDFPLNTGSIVALAVILHIAYVFSLVIYRLYLHPIARFPGPKLAAATKWYEFYFDVIQKPGGQFSKHVAELHRLYGPIVRINPDELHIQDPEFYETVYAGKRDKWPPAAKMAGFDLSSFAAVSHEVHRQRRAAVSPMMARRAIIDAIPIIEQQLVNLQEAFQNSASGGKPLELGVTFLAFTTDVASQYFFRQTLGMQDNAHKAATWKHATHSVALGTPIMKQFPGVLKPAMKIPLGVWKVLDPVTSALVQMQHDMRASAKEFLEDMRLNPDAKMSVNGRSPTVFHAIYCNPGPDASDLHQRLSDEGLSIIVAGSDTTAKVLTRALYYLCSNRQALTRLRFDIQEAARRAGKDTQDLSIVELEGVLWLTAVIKETLRIATIATSRFPLQSYTPVQYREWTIPGMVPISMSPRDVLLDPTIYPEPDSFKPSRWLVTAEDGKQRMNSNLDRFFVAFGKGPRMCHGINLAWAELYLGLAALVPKFDFELFDVIKERDIDYIGDFFLGEVRSDTHGVQVKVKTYE